MIDQSHNLNDPIEDLIQSAAEFHPACVKAPLVARPALTRYQEINDVVLAERTLKIAFETDVAPVLAEARRRKGAAIDPIVVFGKSGYLAELVKQAQAGNEVLLTEGNKRVARLAPALGQPATSAPLQIRSLTGHRVLTQVISQSELPEEMFGPKWLA